MKKARRIAIALVLDLGVPTLGICYGMQLMTDMLGGTLARSGASRVWPRDGAPRVRRRRRGC